MRAIVTSLCALFVAASSPISLRGAPQESTLFPREKSPLSQLFTVPPPAAPKAPQTVRVEVQPGVQEQVRSLRARVECGIKVIEGDPNVDPKIVIPIPEHGQNAKIRVIAPPPCDGRR